MVNPLKLNRPNPKKFNPRKAGDKAEAGIKGRGGYESVAGSGSSSRKGDLRRGKWMVEMKKTIHASFSVTSEILGKLRNDCLTNGKRPVLIVELGDGRQYAVMALEDFERLTDDQVQD